MRSVYAIGDQRSKVLRRVREYGSRERHSSRLTLCSHAGAVEPECTARLPPTLKVMLAWSTLFRSDGTFGNYLSHLRTVCQVYSVDSSVFDSAELNRAKVSIRKRCNFAKRPKLWLQRAALERIVEWCRGQPASSIFAVPFDLAYALLLRLPSEALPAAAGSCSGQYSLL